MERENVTLKRKLEQVEDHVKERDGEISRVNKRVRTLEKDNSMLHKTTSAYENDRRDLEREVGVLCQT